MLSLKGCFLITDVPFTSSCSLFYGLHALVSLRVRASSELDLETVPFSLFPAFRRVCGERGEELPEASIAGHLLLSPCHPGCLAEAAFVVLHGAKRQLCAFCERCRASAASKSLRAPGFASDRVGSCWFCDVDTLPSRTRDSKACCSAVLNCSIWISAILRSSPTRRCATALCVPIERACDVDTPRLQSIILDNNSITDLGVTCLLSGLSLRSLSVAFCCNITDKSFACIGEKSESRLKEVNVMWCGKLTDESIRRLQRCKKLSRIGVKGCALSTPVLHSCEERGVILF